MKNLKFKTILLLITGLLIASTNVYAQRGYNGWGQNSNYGRLFNTKTIETISGTVEAVEIISMDTKMPTGIHLKVKTKSEIISVHLGPSWYLDNQEIQFEKGDKITVTGSRISYQNSPAVIAAEVVKGDHILHLRNKAGYPVWNGWRKKGIGKRRNSNF
ncbi:MAG: hypothetical protein WC389_18040 [Lutibacter sp.]|jgi:hypothetical protein